MKRLVKCPNGHTFRCDETHLGRKVKCAHAGCDLKFRLQAIDELDSASVDLIERCRQCGHLLPIAAVICVQCGTRQDGDEQVLTAVEGPLAEEKPKFNDLLYGHRAKSPANKEVDDFHNPGMVIKSGFMAIVMVLVAQINAQSYKPFWLPDFLHSHLANWWSTIFYVLAGILGLAAIVAALPAPKEEAQPRTARSSFAERLRQRLRESRTSIPEATVESVLVELEKSNEKSANRTRSLIVFGASIAAFFLIGLLFFDTVTLLLVIAVLFAHETGHYIAMRLFGYRDVTMFFIPLFGAAVSGTNERAHGWQRAVIALAGPLPGLALGWGLVPAYLSYQEPWLGVTVFVLIAMNALNLAPMFPLDGGRFLNEILFSRHPLSEIVFRLLTALCLIVIGVLIWSVMLMIFGALVLLGAWSTSNTIRAAARAKQTVPLNSITPSQQMPPEIAAQIIVAVRESMPKVSDAAAIASMTRGVWERLHTRPPGWLASIALLALYGTALASVPIMPVIFAVLISNGVLPEPETGYAAEFFAGFDDGLNRE